MFHVPLHSFLILTTQWIATMSDCSSLRKVTHFPLWTASEDPRLEMRTAKRAPQLQPQCLNCHFPQWAMVFIAYSKWKTILILGTSNLSCDILSCRENTLNFNQESRPFRLHHLRPPPISIFHLGQYSRVVDTSMDLDEYWKQFYN
jgi:hypothetical protein